MCGTVSVNKQLFQFLIDRRIKDMRAGNRCCRIDKETGTARPYDNVAVVSLIGHDNLKNTVLYLVNLLVGSGNGSSLRYS